MMKAVLFALAVLVLTPALCFAQVAGGAASYGQGSGKARADQNERNKRRMLDTDLPPTLTGTFVEANVLMNVKADEYVAVFGVAEEGATVAECEQKMDATIKDFTGRIRGLGIAADAYYVDFIAQNKTYGFDVNGNLAKEKVTGFELKKNVSVRYKDPALLDKLLVAASQSQIFDLIKVDYVVKDIAAVQDRLMEEAGRIIKVKTARYEKLLGVKFPNPPQVYAERPSIYYPTDMYDSYVAFEGESVTSNDYRQKYTVQSARKTRTFYYNGLTGDGFDTVINPVIVEPVVQFTLYLKVRYDTATAPTSQQPATNKP